MEGMKIPGTITRLVPGTKKDGSDGRVFLRPDDPAAVRKLDGAQYLASGEIATTENLEGLEVGEAHEIEVSVAGENEE